jgi:hypothetical protein
MAKRSEHTLEFLLAFHGRTHHLDRGYRLEFEIERIAATPQRPHGLRYAFTLHAPGGKRLIGFDNAHGVPARGSRFKKRATAHDHWHRTENDEGRPYAFVDADTLLADFFREVGRVLAERNVPETVIRDEDSEKERLP